MIEPSYILAFFAGLVTIASPCIIPILPPMLAGSVGSRLRPIAIILGTSVTFTLMGGFFAAIGSIVGSFTYYLRYFSIFIIIALGVILIDRGLNQKFQEISSIFVNKIMKIIPSKKGGSGTHGGQNQTEGLVGAFILGLSLGIVWIPCVGPILGAILTYVVIGGSVLQGSMFLFVYSIGLGIPMLIIAYSGKMTATRIKGIAEHGELLKRIAGAVLILTGVAMIFGVDSYFRLVLLKYFPLTQDELILKYFG